MKDERGFVEATYSCGRGALASVVWFAQSEDSHRDIRTKSRKLRRQPPHDHNQSCRVHSIIPDTSSETVIMADVKEVTLNSVQVEALVVMKILKHANAQWPTTASGSIVGMDVDSILEITSSFPFPTTEVSTSDSHQNDHNSASNSASAAPRSKANTAYQESMIKLLREVNVDANNVGFYTSANMGNFVTLNFIENLYHYQSQTNERVVALVYDVSRSSQGALSLRAFRLSPVFLAAYKEGVAKFTTEKYVLLPHFIEQN